MQKLTMEHASGLHRYWTPSTIMTPQPPSSITKPDRKAANLKQGTVLLEFPAAPEMENPLNGEYYMRGGICWPLTPMSPNGIAAGFAVMVGLNVKSQGCIVFDEHDFVVIDNITDDTSSKIINVGAGSFFNRCWSDFFADTYHIVQPDAVHRPYMLDCIRSKSVQPKPHFIAVPGETEDTCERKIWEAMAAGRLKYKRGGMVATALDLRRIQRGNNPGRVVVALGAALTGISLYPPRRT